MKGQTALESFEKVEKALRDLWATIGAIVFEPILDWLDGLVKGGTK